MALGTSNQHQVSYVIVCRFCNTFRQIPRMNSPFAHIPSSLIPTDFSEVSVDATFYGPLYAFRPYMYACHMLPVPRPHRSGLI